MDKFELIALPDPQDYYEGAEPSELQIAKTFDKTQYEAIGRFVAACAKAGYRGFDVRWPNG